MKNKTYLLFLLILLMILTSISYGINKYTTKETISNNNNIKTNLKKQKNYNKKNNSRYMDYYKKNNHLPLKKIITYVNIGLDKPFYTNIQETTNLNNINILVNKYISLPKDYIPNNLEEIDINYALPGMKLVKDAKNAFESMAKDAKKENLTIIAMSTYRSYEYQKNLYSNYVNKDGVEKANQYSAKPGHSEHQTALAVDIYNKEKPYTEFENTKEFLWMQENAYKYGFILRYPKYKTHITGYQYEAWHYRYIGTDIAEYIHKNDLTYDEYYYEFIEKNEQ